MPSPSGSTAKFAFPYMNEIDVPDVATASELLAQGIENIIATAYEGTAAARPAFGLFGRWYYATDTSALSFDAGTVWITVGTVTLTGTMTLTNKRIPPRVASVTQSATPIIDTDNADIFTITGLAQDVTSFTTHLTGTPGYGEMFMLHITDNGAARNLAWGADFASTTSTLPPFTVASTRLRVLFQWDGSAWDCLGQT